MFSFVIAYLVSSDKVSLHPAVQPLAYRLFYVHGFESWNLCIRDAYISIVINPQVIKVCLLVILSGSISPFHVPLTHLLPYIDLMYICTIAVSISEQQHCKMPHNGFHIAPNTKRACQAHFKGTYILHLII